MIFSCDIYNNSSSARLNKSLTWSKPKIPNRVGKYLKLIKMKKIFLALPLFALAIIGCEKENVTETADNESPKVETRAGEFVNPYEWCGVAHNAGVQHLLDVESRDYDDLVDYLAVYFDMEVANFPLYYEIEGGISMILDPEEDYIASLSLGTAIMDVFDSMDDILSTSADISNDFDDLAETIYLSETYSSNDKISLLGSIAVAKYSNILWSDDEDLDIAEKNGVVKADWKGFWSGWRGGTFPHKNMWGIASGCKASDDKRDEISLEIIPD